MRPSNLIYSVDESPPALVCFVNAAQLLVTLAAPLITVIIVLRAGGASETTAADAVSLALVACGVGTVLQVFPGRWTGSGYLIGIAPAAAYIPASIAALKSGGLPLLAGMTMLAGAFELLFAQVVRRFRPFFPAEISGLCILLIGIFLGVLAMQIAFGVDPATLRATATTPELVLTVATLALMIGLNLWGRGILRMLCAIIGTACGYAAAVVLGLVDPASMRVLSHSAVFALPHWIPHLPSLSADLIVPFVAAALTCGLRGMGDVSVAQKINDSDWVRPDMTSIRKGIVANGLATVAASLIGGMGGNTQSSTIGISNASGVTSRRVGYWLAGILVVLSMFPIVSAVFVAMPRAVSGALLLFTSCFIVIGGLQIITTRLLDARRAFIVGLALALSLSREVFPGVYEHAPAALQPFVSSGLVIGLLAALVLNALFRIGVRSRASITVAPAADAHQTVRAFLEQQGAKWGARRDVVAQAIFGTEQALETIREHCNVQGPVTLEAAFDEFNLDINISYQGDDFVLSDRRPTQAQIVESPDGLRLLAGYLIQRNADRVRTIRKGDRAVLEFHFQH